VRSKTNKKKQQAAATSFLMRREQRPQEGAPSRGWHLQDPAAEFRETFRFKEKVRRQKHSFRMEDMNTIVGFAKAAGWEYIGYTDLTPVGAEYMFHLHFKRS
jgi:hypothetical protein